MPGLLTFGFSLDEDKMEQDAVGPSRYKSFLCPLCLVCRKQFHLTSLTFPDFQREDSNSCLSGKGGNAETKEKQ